MGHSITAPIRWPLNQSKPDIAISNDPLCNNGIYSHILANIYFPKFQGSGSIDVIFKAREGVNNFIKGVTFGRSIIQENHLTIKNINFKIRLIYYC